MQRVKWPEFKSFVDSRGLSVHYYNFDGRDHVYAFDGPLYLYTRMRTESGHSTETDDWLDNYKPNANTKISQLDESGRTIQRVAAAQKGWHYQMHAVSFTTASDQTFYNKDDSGTDLGFVTYTMYDSGDAVTTVNANAVKTVVTWCPSHDYEIIGGELTQAAPPVTDVYMWTKGLPGITNTMFSQGGINLKLTGINILSVDGRASKFLKYNDPIPGTNKFEIIIKHGAGVQHEMQMLYEIFKA